MNDGVKGHSSLPLLRFFLINPVAKKYFEAEAKRNRFKEEDRGGRTGVDDGEVVRRDDGELWRTRKSVLELG
jgi:hypothetical protein